MNDLAYREYLQGCEYVPMEEVESRFLEMWNFSGESEPLIREGPLSDEELNDFLDQKGAHAPPSPPEGCEVLGGHRLIIRKYPCDAQNLFPFKNEEVMTTVINKLQLPKQLPLAWGWNGGASWSTQEVQDRDLCLHVVFKDTICKNFITYAVSYNTRTHVTSGFLGGGQGLIYTREFKGSAHMAHHPLILPLHIYRWRLQNCVVRNDEAQELLNNIDYGLGLNADTAFRPYPEPPGNYKQLNRDIVSASEAVWHSRYRDIEGLSKALQNAFCLIDSVFGVLNKNSAHEQLRGHFSFLTQTHEHQLRAVEQFKGRIPVFASALYNLMAQKDNKLNISVAADSRRIASLSKRDSSAMKTIAVLTIVFLPGTFVSAIFSTSLFNFRANNGEPTMSAKFWIYWAITIPLTVVVVGIWTVWYYWSDRKQARQDSDLEKSIDGAHDAIDDDETSQDGGNE